MPNSPSGNSRLDAIIAAKARAPSRPSPGSSHHNCGAWANTATGPQTTISQTAKGASTSISRINPDKASRRIQRRNMKYGG
ncbi:hypothetical protein D3C72_2186230 [compost metagenome]